MAAYGEIPMAAVITDEQAATKLISRAITRAETKWRAVRNWTQALAAFKIYFEDRIPD